MARTGRSPTCGSTRRSSPSVTSALVQAVVHNYGPTEAERVRARLVVDGQLGPEQTVDLSPSARTCPSSSPRPSPRPATTWSRSRSTTTRSSSTTAAGWPSRSASTLNVLLVDGDFKTEPFQAETDYLAQALSPESTSAGRPSVIRPMSIPESQLSRARPDPVRRRRPLQHRPVHRGRGRRARRLPEARGRRGRLRRRSGRARQLQPAPLRRRQGPLARLDRPGRRRRGRRRSRASASTRSGYRHPIVAEFAGEPTRSIAGPDRAKTWQFHKLKLPDGSQAKVALAFDNGDPAVIEAPRHRGTVIQVATSADAGWTTWPLHQSYPPVMEQIVLQAASGRMAERNVRVGQPLDQSLPAAGAAGLGLGPRSRARPVEALDQAPGGRRREPAPFRGHRAVRPVPGQDRPAARDRSRPSPRTPTRPRATPPSSIAPGWSRPSRAGTSPT